MDLVWLSQTRDGIGDSLVIIDTGTGVQRTIFSSSAPTPDGSLLGAVRLSPDGRTVLMNVSPFTGHVWFPFLYSIPVDGGTPMRLARGQTNGLHPISDDGTIVFTSPGPTNYNFLYGDALNVYTMRPAGTGIKQLTQFTVPDAAWALFADITPDGKRVLFVTTDGDVDLKSKVWVVGADGEGLRSLPIDPNVHSVAFSRDGSLVAWVSARQIHLMTTDAGEDRVLASFAYSDVPGVGTGMEFAPDNSTLYFLLGEPGGNGATGALPIGSALWSINLQTGSVQQLYAPRTLSPGGILGRYSDLTPGGFITAYGTNLTGDGLFVAPIPPKPGLPLSLAGVSLLVNGKPAPIAAVTPWQLNAAIPMDTPPGQVSFRFQFQDGTVTQAWTARVVRSSPSCVAVVHTNGTPVDEVHPAHAGEVLVTYGVGAGPTNPPVADGQPAPFLPLSTLTIPLSVSSSSTGADVQLKVLWAGLSPGAVGLYQANVQLQEQIPPSLSYVTPGWTQNGIYTTGCRVWVH